MEKNKGFTLVELLAVIVILAIIMIIAIPAVLNTMETAKKKSMVEFAQKAMNKAEEKYYESITMGKSMNTGADQNCIVYDISKDLGINNTGDYYGFVSIQITDAIDTDRTGILKPVYAVNKSIMMLQGDLILFYDTVVKQEISTENIVSGVELTNLLKQNNIKIKDFPFKELQSYFMYNQNCNYFSIGIIDGATGEQMRDINYPDLETYYHFDVNGVYTCKTPEETMELNRNGMAEIISNMKKAG